MNFFIAQLLNHSVEYKNSHWLIIREHESKSRWLKSVWNFRSLNWGKMVDQNYLKIFESTTAYWYLSTLHPSKIPKNFHLDFLLCVNIPVWDGTNRMAWFYYLIEFMNNVISVYVSSEDGINFITLIYQEICTCTHSGCLRTCRKGTYSHNLRFIKLWSYHPLDRKSKINLSEEVDVLAINLGTNWNRKLCVLFFKENKVVKFFLTAFHIISSRTTPSLPLPPSKTKLSRTLTMK